MLEARARYYERGCGNGGRCRCRGERNRIRSGDKSRAWFSSLLGDVSQSSWRGSLNPLAFPAGCNKTPRRLRWSVAFTSRLTHHYNCYWRENIKSLSKRSGWGDIVVVPQALQWGDVGKEWMKRHCKRIARHELRSFEREDKESSRQAGRSPLYLLLTCRQYLCR